MHRAISTWIMALSTALGAMVVSSATAKAQTANGPDLTDKVGTLEVAFWLPSPGSDPAPLVLFSHGFHGCNTQSKYLMRALAQNGFVVAAPNHQDNRCGQPPLPLDLSDLSEKTLESRRDDMHKLRTEVLGHEHVGGRIDQAKVMLVGHSLGGSTVLALAGAGAGAGWKMNGILGAVALAPYTNLPLINGTLGDISAPVLIEAGDKDLIAGASKDAYSKIPAPACRVVYEGAGHLAWVDDAVAFSSIPGQPQIPEQPQFRAPTAEAAVAFLNNLLDPKAPKIQPSPLAKTECK